MRSLPSAADGFINAASALPDSPTLEMDLAEDQRAALEFFYAGEPRPTDAEIDARRDLESSIGCAYVRGFVAGFIDGISFGLIRPRRSA
ncbi:MAG TPA: hypothetical protein VGR35_00215 [Tepidisphaeraceae bacterium]|nr:hypothetical protein [Tepidisphaeraceae bacterium]